MHPKNKAYDEHIKIYQFFSFIPFFLILLTPSNRVEKCGGAQQRGTRTWGLYKLKRSQVRERAWISEAHKP